MVVALTPSRDRLDRDHSIDLRTFHTIRHSDSNGVLDAKISALHTEGSLVSWASSTLVPPIRLELIPGDNTTLRDIRDRKINPTFFAREALNSTDRGDGIDVHVTVRIQIANRIIVSKIAGRDWCLRTSLWFTADELEVTTEPVTILTDAMEDFLTSDMTVIVLEETTTNRNEISCLGIKDGSVVQVSIPLSVQETASDEHVSVVQPSSLPDIVVDTVVLCGTHPDSRHRIVLADTVMLDTLRNIDSIIEDVATAHSVEDAGLVHHEDAHCASEFFLESGAAVKWDAGKARKTLWEVTDIERAQMPEAAMTECSPVLSCVIPLCNVVSKVLVVGAEVDKGESTTDVDVSGSLCSVEEDAVDRKGMLCSQRTKALAHGEVITSRGDASDLTRKIVKHIGHLLAGRSCHVKITIGVPNDVLHRGIASATVALDFKALEVRHERRPSVCSRIINGNTLPSLRCTVDPEAVIMPLHALRDGGKAFTAFWTPVCSDWPVALLPAVAPDVPPVVSLSFPGTTHVENITDPEKAGDVRNATATVKAGLCSHGRPLGVAEGALPVLEASERGHIDDGNDSRIVEGIRLIWQRRALLCEINVRVPPGKEVALEGAVLLWLATDAAESTVEDDIIGTDDGQAADRHGEATQTRAHLLPSVGDRVIDDTKMDISTASAGRVEEARIRSWGLVTTKGASDVNLSIRTFLDGVSITAEATTTGGVSPYLVDRVPASDGVDGRGRACALLEGTNDPDVTVVTDEEVVDCSLIEVSQITSALEDLLVLDDAVSCL